MFYEKYKYQNVYILYAICLLMCLSLTNCRNFSKKASKDPQRILASMNASDYCDVTGYEKMQEIKEAVVNISYNQMIKDIMASKGFSVNTAEVEEFIGYGSMSKNIIIVKNQAAVCDSSLTEDQCSEKLKEFILWTKYAVSCSAFLKGSPYMGDNYGSQIMAVVGNDYWGLFRDITMLQDYIGGSYSRQRVLEIQSKIISVSEKKSFVEYLNKLDAARKDRGLQPLSQDLINL